MASDDAEYIGVSELAAAVGDALSEIAQIDRKMKSGATEIPGERTIRFYLEKGLLPKPSKRMGQTLVFGRVHLLHLLVIKKLQADGVPLSAIPDILKKKGKTEVQLEELLNEDVQIFRSRRSLNEYRQRTGHTDDSDVVETLDMAAMPEEELDDEPSVLARRQSYSTPPSQPRLEERPASGAKSYLKSLLSRSSQPESPQSTQRKSQEPDLDIQFSMMPSPASARWTRHEPAAGVEINISDDYEPPADEQGKARLIERLRKILGL